ncbi:MAG TPA: ABC transporter permease [Candidatus Dormibacteraeota bacterium]
MLTYLGRRLILMLPVAFLVSVVVFALARLAPGDPAVILLGEEHDPTAVAALHHELGLDQPLPVQYLVWAGRATRGDLGRSIQTHQPVLQAIGERLPATLELGLAALLWSLLVAIPLGTVAALRRGTPLDYLASGFTVAGVSIPNFFVGVLLILVMGLALRLFPVGGFVPLNQDPLLNLQHLVLPALTLGTAGAAINMRFTRSSMIEVLGQEYIRTALAKGASWLQVVRDHALKNALIPVVTIVAIQVGSIIEGALVTESVFSWPGVGKLAVDGIFNKDYPVIQGIVLCAALSYLTANLLVDVVYAWLDPRISYR